MQNLALYLYRLLTLLLYPAIFTLDTWRAATTPIYRAHRIERWGIRLPKVDRSRPRIWIHAVSVGETQASAPLITELINKYPNHQIVLTHMTPTGRDTGAHLFAPQIENGLLVQCYLPYDLIGLPSRFLKHFSPCIGLLMETEIWPNTVSAAKARNIPLGLANARLSNKSLIWTKRLAYLASPTYNALTWIAAQSDAVRQRFEVVCNVSVHSVGNLKFEVSPDEQQLKAGQLFATDFFQTTGRNMLALASTRDGEEALLLPLITQWLQRQALAPLLLLIPRHPKRKDELLQLCKNANLNTVVRSTGDSVLADTQVYLCDTLGEMWFFYSASRIAIIGGGWLPFGGQNLIEPCMAGCATIVGPHMFNFVDASKKALEAGAIVQCTTTAELIKALDAISAKQAQFSQQARLFAANHKGSIAKHMQLIDAVIKN